MDVPSMRGGMDLVRDTKLPTDDGRAWMPRVLY